MPSLIKIHQQATTPSKLTQLPAHEHAARRRRAKVTQLPGLAVPRTTSVKRTAMPR